MRIRMKNLMVLMTAGMIMGVALNAGALTLSNMSITDTNAGTVTISVDVSDTSMMSPAMCLAIATLTNGLSKCYAQPDNTMIVADQTWTSTNWYPYLRGVYNVVVQGVTFSQEGATITEASALHAVTTNREVSGTINSIKYQDSSTNWVDINLSNVSLHCMGIMSDQVGAESLPCNLLNNTVDIFSGEEQAEDECPFDDIGEHYPAGTVFRFSMDLHAKSTTFMGMGLVQRYVWTPADSNSPSGPGTLELDIASCSPWRSSASAALGAHVGFCPIYIPEGMPEAELFDGSFMCNTAHYMDVYPTNTSERIGIIVNGHPGTTNYLRCFMSDHLISMWGVTNAETEIGGFLNGELVDSSVVEMTRIEGGTNDIIYDADGDGVGDSGYLVQFTFEYPAETVTKSSTDAVIAQVGLTSSVTVVTSAPVGDFDGDGKTDLAVYHEATGYWYIILSSDSSLSYQQFGTTGYEPKPADYDGDGKTDLTVYQESSGYWYIIESSSGELSYSKLGDPGYTPVR